MASVAVFKTARSEAGLVLRAATARHASAKVRPKKGRLKHGGVETAVLRGERAISRRRVSSGRGLGRRRSLSLEITVGPISALASRIRVFACGRGENNWQKLGGTTLRKKSWR